MKVARIVREVGGHIINFLAALEDFQKALWEKKKLVFETRYVITLDRLERYAPVWLAQNIEAIIKKQRAEWKDLGLGDYAKATACIRKTKGDLATAAAEKSAWASSSRPIWARAAPRRPRTSGSPSMLGVLVVKAFRTPMAS